MDEAVEAECDDAVGALARSMRRAGGLAPSLRVGVVVSVAGLDAASGLPAKGHAGGVIEALRCGGEDDGEDAIDNGNGLVMVRLDDGPTVAVHASAQPHSTSSARTRSSSTDASGTCFRCIQCGMPTAGSLAVERSRHMLTQYMSGSTFPLPYSPDPHARTSPVKTRARR